MKRVKRTLTIPAFSCIYVYISMSALDGCCGSLLSPSCRYPADLNITGPHLGTCYRYFRCELSSRFFGKG